MHKKNALEPLFQRLPSNPILKAAHWPYQVNSLRWVGTGSIKQLLHWLDANERP